MDLAMALAEEVGADLVVANDPDADRCAVAVPGPHGWQMLRGDEVGALLADHLLRLRPRGRLRHLDRLLQPAGQDGASAEKQPYAETLTGFKWIGRVPAPRVRLRGGARLLRRPGAREGQGRRLRAADGLRHRRPREGARGARCATILDDLARRYGLHATDQLSVRWTTSRRSPRVLDRLRDAAPDSLGGLAVAGVDDLARGLRARAADQRAALPAGGRAPGSSYARRGPSRSSSATSRSSCRSSDEEDGVDAARISAAGRLDAIRGDLRAAAGL